MLVDVAEQVLPRHPDWQWLILGEGEDRPMLEEKIARAGIGKQLILKGRVPDTDSYYRQSAFFVLTSRFEGLPMVLLEAKAYGLPIVSFDCPTGPSEIIEDALNGNLVRPDDISGMAESVNRLIEDRAIRERYALHAGDGDGRFAKETIIDQWKTLLNMVLRPISR